MRCRDPKNALAEMKENLANINAVNAAIDGYTAFNNAAIPNLQAAIEKRLEQLCTAYNQQTYNMVIEVGNGNLELKQKILKSRGYDSDNRSLTEETIAGLRKSARIEIESFYDYLQYMRADRDEFNPSASIVGNKGRLMALLNSCFTEAELQAHGLTYDAVTEQKDLDKVRKAVILASMIFTMESTYLKNNQDELVKISNQVSRDDKLSPEEKGNAVLAEIYKLQPFNIHHKGENHLDELMSIVENTLQLHQSINAAKETYCSDDTNANLFAFVKLKLAELLDKVKTMTSISFLDRYDITMTITDYLANPNPDNRKAMLTLEARLNETYHAHPDPDVARLINDIGSTASTIPYGSPRAQQKAQPNISGMFHHPEKTSLSSSEIEPSLAPISPRFDGKG